MTVFEDLKWRGLINDVTSPDVEDAINKGGLKFYIGVDPTGDSLHIGHYCTVIATSKRLLEAGHTPIIIAGGGTGFESFLFNGTVSASTNKLQNYIHDEIMKKIKGVKDRGKKKANFHMLRESRMIAVLTENMFIDSTIDSDLLKNETFINQLAEGHVNGIVKMYGLKKKKVSNVSSKGDIFYRVVAGSFKDRKNADEQVKKLKKLGIDVFIDVYKK